MNDPFAPDAPLIHLLSITENPLLADASEEQLTALVKRLRTVSQQQPTLKAKLAEGAKSPRTSKRKALLDSI